MLTFAAIIPNYNDGARIDKALRGLFEQTHPFDEILIIDDGSTDDSVAIIEKLIAGRKNARLIRQTRNQGIVATINAGVQQCTTDFLWLCSANDTYNTQALQYCSRALEQYPDTAMLCGNAEFWYKKDNRARSVSMHLPQTPHYIPPEAFHALICQSPLTFFGGGVIMRRQALLDMQCLRSELRWHSDWTAYYLLAFKYGIYFIPEAFVTVEVTEESFSSKAMIWKQQRPVIYALITLLARDYAAVKEQWKSAALLPTYSLHELSILCLPECRWYITPLLLWRMLIHSMAYRLKYYLPRSFLIQLRTVFKV